MGRTFLGLACLPLAFLLATPSRAADGIPDLTIVKTHAGNFYQGQTGAAYSITVSNIGTGNTTAPITVVDTLPAGLTATAISGTGDSNWSCTLATLTCTRSDVLVNGSSYDAIAVTVNVAVNAAASLTNTATVSGGGEINTSNDTATSITTITPLLQIASGPYLNPAAVGTNSSLTSPRPGALEPTHGRFGIAPGMVVSECHRLPAGNIPVRRLVPVHRHRDGRKANRLGDSHAARRHHLRLRLRSRGHQSAGLLPARKLLWNERDR